MNIVPREYPAAILRTLLITIVLVFIALLVFATFTAGPRDWAEITLKSVQATDEGYVTLVFTTRFPAGGGIESEYCVDGVTNSQRSCRGWSWSFRTVAGSDCVDFSLNPAHEADSGCFTNSRLFTRLLWRVGETWVIQPGETLPLYDFMAAGKRYTWRYRVILRDTPF